MRWDDGDVCPAEPPELARPPRAMPKYGWDKTPIFRGFVNWKNDLQLIMQVCLIDWSTNTHHSIFGHCLVIDTFSPIFYGYHATRFFCTS